METKSSASTGKMTLRRFWLWLHRYVGLIAAIFLVVAGITGSILAFAPDYDSWLHPSLWNVTPRGSPLSEEELLHRVEHEFGTVRVEQIRLSGARSAQVFLLSDGRSLFVNPYSGAILGVRSGPSGADNFVLAVHELHVALFAGNTGESIVNAATAASLLLVCSGLYLWWDKKRLNIKWTATWRRIIWDVHNISGFYGFALFFILGASGLLVAFETPLYWMVRSQPWDPGALPHSDVTQAVVQGSHAPDLDALRRAADRALPGASTYQIVLPKYPRSAVQILKRGPGLAGHSTVYLDRYTGAILRVDDLSKLPRAYRAHFINQALHTGAILGFPTEAILALASLALAISALTGFLLWWKKISA